MMNIVFIALIIAIGIGIANKFAWLLKTAVSIALVVMVLNMLGVIQV